MPLLDENGLYICIECLSERVIADPDWVLHETDKTIFTSPPCPTCGSQETFFWHDVVQLKTVGEERVLPSTDPRGPNQRVWVSWQEPDPEDFRARQMVVIGVIAARLSRELNLLNSLPPQIKYPKTPKKFSAAEMRAEAVQINKSRSRVLPLRSKQHADETFDAAIAEANQLRSRRVKDLKNGSQLRAAVPLEVAGASKKKPTKPEVDPKEVKVDNEPSLKSARDVSSKARVAKKRGKKK